MTQILRSGRLRSQRVAVLAVWAVLVVSVATACVPRPPVELDKPGGEYSIAVKYNVAITTRDGRVLRADVYRPADPTTQAPAAGEFPVIVGLTPYGKSMGVEGTGGGGVNLDLVRAGYIAVVADVPGTGVSDGEFSLFSPTESDASVDLIRWAGDLDGSTGKVGMIGHSYSAINQLFAAAKVGPDSPLKAIFPMSPTVDPYRDLFVSGGALNVMSPLGLLFSYGITRSLTPFVEADGNIGLALAHAQANFEQMGRFEGVMATDMLENGERRYFDDFWAAREPAAQLQQIVDNGVAVFMVGGLYDVFQRGVPLIYSGLQNAVAGRDVYAPMAPDQPASARFQGLFGPWTHGSMGGAGGLTQLQLRWFDHWLKGIDNGVDAVEEPLQIIEPGGTEYSTATYPLGDAPARRFWLGPDRSLGANQPTGSEESPDPAGTDSIAYIPFGDTCSASTVQFAAGLMADQCLKPMRKPEGGVGEVTYSTDPVAAPMQLAGPIGLTLRAASTTTDAFFAVTIEDVAPDGTSMGITGGSQLASMRKVDLAKSWTGPGDSMTRPYLTLTRADLEPVTPGEVVTYRVEIRPAFATIPTGHRLRLRISTSDFPHIIPLADLWNLVGGRYDIHHDWVNPSFIDIPIRDAAPMSF